MTLGTLADDIILRLTQSAPTDDSEIEKSQVMHLLAIHRDLLAQNQLNQQIANSQPLETVYKDRLIASASVEDETNVVSDDERLFVTLPAQPLALANDRGVIQVLNQEYLPVLRYRNENFTVYQNLRFAKASPNNLCFYRDNRKIIIKGITQKNKDNDTFIVDYMPSLASQTLTEATDVKISDSLLPELTAMVEEVMKRQMHLPVQDLTNDGVQEPTK